MDDQESQEYSHALIKRERELDPYDADERDGESVFPERYKNKSNYKYLTDNIFDKITKIFDREKRVANNDNSMYTGDIANNRNFNQPFYTTLEDSYSHANNNTYRESITVKSRNPKHSKSKYQELFKDYIIKPLNQSATSEGDDEIKEQSEENKILFDDDNDGNLSSSVNKRIKKYYDSHRTQAKPKHKGNIIKLVKYFNSKESIYNRTTFTIIKDKWFS
ncbi:unnamed protein product [Gordionus sp. m RMFG-2023]